LNKTRLLFLALLALLLGARLCHTGILWAEETLPLAAAQEMRAGHTLYRDIWFDKPPFVALLDLPLAPGWTLRTAGALYGLLACWIAYRFARDLWGEREGRMAAALLASVRLRRPRHALLKALGLTRGQIRATVAGQASVILLAASVVGVPLGIAVGRWAWAAFATSLGAVPVTVVPVPALLAGIVVLLVAGNLLAAGPGAVAARTPPAAVLRTE